VLVAWALRLAAELTHGPTRTCARFGYNAALAVWAWDELARGLNGVRRAYGAIGLFCVAARAGAALRRRWRRAARPYAAHVDDEYRPVNPVVERVL
jgi:hypothetical protein